MARAKKKRAASRELDGKGRHVAAYMRVSTSGQSFPTQRHAIERVSRARGDVVHAWFEEKKSAATTDRSTLHEVRALARAGKLRKLYVYAIDRLSRTDSIRETLQVAEELQKHGCSVISCSDGFDIDGPASDLVLAVIAFGAKFERRRIGARVRDAHAAHKAAGRPWGRPRAVAAIKQREIHALKAKGLSIRDVARKARVRRSTVANVLSKKGPYAEPSKSRKKK